MLRAGTIVRYGGGELGIVMEYLGTEYLYVGGSDGKLHLIYSDEIEGEEGDFHEFIRPFSEWVAGK